MSIKRGLIVLLTGAAVEIGVLWAVDHYTQFKLIQRIEWDNFILWQNFIAGFLTACWLVLWDKLIRKIFGPGKKKTSAPDQKPAASAASTQQNNAPPARMNVQNHAILSVPPTGQPGNTPMDSTPQMPQTAPITPAAPQVSAPSQKSQDIDMLCKLEPDLDMMSFKHVNLEGKNIDLVYSSDTNALLCAVFSEPHTWTVDTSVGIEDSIWTDENGHTDQPCLLLLRQAAALEKMEPNSMLTPTLLLMRGTIQNYEDAVPYLAANHIQVVTYQPSVMAGVQTIVDLLRQQFTPFPPSYDVVTENMQRGQDITPPDSGDEDNG